MQCGVREDERKITHYSAHVYDQLCAYLKSPEADPEEALALYQQILGTPLVAIVMLLFIGMGIYHMWLGMQEIIVDYIHDEFWKLVVLMGNTPSAAELRSKAVAIVAPI